MGKPRTVRVLGDLVKSHKPAFLFLSETLVDNIVIADLHAKLGFSEFFAVNRIGQGGGLAVKWKQSVVYKVVDSSVNHIDVVFLGKNSPEWRLSCFYGMPERTRRQESWDFL